MTNLLPGLGRFAAALAIAASAASGGHGAGFGEPIVHSVGGIAAIPNGLVADITQDRTGFLWIATHDGLVRYDGYELRLFRHDAKDPHSLPENRIRTIETGNDGRLWIISSTEGVSIYDPATERFRKLAKTHGMPRALVRGKGGMWIATAAGIDFVDETTLTITHFDAAPPGVANAAKRNDIGSLMLDRDGNLWIGSVTGLTVRRPNGTLEAAGLDGKAIYRIFPTSHGTLWITVFGGGLFILERSAAAASISSASSTTSSRSRRSRPGSSSSTRAHSIRRR